jgi:predicted nucleic-acid-binding protein
MKQIILLLTLFISVNSFSQKVTKQQDIQTLINAMQIKATMQSIVDKGIETYKKQKPAVSQQVWNDIKSKVDYTSYISQVANIFDNNYSQLEIKSLVAAIKPNQLPQFKKIVQQQLYQAGNDFGKKFGTLINQALTSNGY